MPQRETPTLVLGLLAFCAGAIVLIVALVLGLTIEASPKTMADSAKGHLIAVPGVIAVLAAVVALNARRRRRGLVVGWVAASAAVVAVLLTLLLPGGEY